MAIELDIDARAVRNLVFELDRDALEAWLGMVVTEALNVIQRETRKGGRGRVYRRRGRVHRASAPGDYPAVDTGNLTNKTRIRVDWPEAEIGTNVFYAKFLQYGTSKMAPRKLYPDALVDALNRLHGPDRVIKVR